jgi:hypothetical protein
MQLTADTFLEIVQSLRSDKSTGGLREQRRNPRVGVRGRATIMVSHRSSPRVIAVNVRDLSGAGIGLLVPEAALEKEDEFLLILPQGIRHNKRAMICTVRRVSQLAESLYSIGALFGAELSAEQMPAMPVVSAKPVSTMAVAGKARSAATRPTPAAASPARPIPAAAPAPAVAAAAAPTIAQGVSADLLQAADADVINALEARLRALTD